MFWKLKYLKENFFIKDCQRNIIKVKLQIQIKNQKDTWEII